MGLVNYSSKRPAAVIKKFGKCLELVPLDRHFHNISVGLYVKQGIFTVWTFSGKRGADERIQVIRDQLVALGGMEPIEGTWNQARFTCDVLHDRPVRFLLSQAVGKSPDFAPSKGSLEIKDTKSELMIGAKGFKREGSWLYRIGVTGEAKNSLMRLRMILAGFNRYGEMDKIGDNEVAFQCRSQHDDLMRLLMPYSRNISSVETMMAAEDMRGQMTTSTLGFSQT
ncbi:MAG: hypothetical protein QF530_05655 [SAR202 cluster bacterium]|jgi:hypothetical protein|nr:hypothetical protein [SAR202 cluster bacterium]